MSIPISVSVTIGLAIMSIVANFLPPLLFTLTPPKQQQTPKCEGYYPDPEVCLKLGSKRPAWYRRNRKNTNCPQWKINNSEWKEKEKFIEKLHDIESIAKEWESVLEEMDANTIEKCGNERIKPRIWIRRERGLAWSRIEDNIIAGNSEYHCNNGICWTDVLLSMYVDKFGVKPSEEFIDF